ncbi:WGR and DUF4132 domain-containing protein [Undibacterium curvum]|uniref:WGR and DUF4132 domain-containing protein n=1 Tax=Undibacterium curvum TaxID=2762294 RepID=A0ABR7A6G1_9BURK|nr:WGR and DUF4132 domain-containing protein [Undibacterium curvum]MBC3932247.1 WGR and DUF4132 domain-containing protein [Undibacterium curvum]
MRHFEYTDTVSAKFWQVEQEQANLHICWGRIGTKGQSQTKSFNDAAKATAAMLKLVAEKTGKGYQEVVLEGTTSVTDAQNVAAVTSSLVKSVSMPKPMPKPVASAPDTTKKEIASATRSDQGAIIIPEVVAETVDEEIERAFIEICGQISRGSLVEPPGGLTVAKIRRLQNISEIAANEVYKQLSRIGLIYSYNGKFRHDAQSFAVRLLPVLFSRTVCALTKSPSSSAIDALDASQRDAIAPWFRNGEPLYISASVGFGIHTHALATRRFPRRINKVEPLQAWLELRDLISLDVNPDFASTDSSLREVFQAAYKTLESLELNGNMQTDVILLVLCLNQQGFSKKRVGTLFVNYLVARHGLLYVVDALLEAEKIEVVQDKSCLHLSTEVSTLLNNRYGTLSDGEWTLREHLAAAPQPEYEACIAKIRAGLPQVPALRQPILALLLPDVPEISNELVHSLCAPDAMSPHTVHWLQATATDPVALALAAKVKNEGIFWDRPDLVNTILLEHGVDAVLWLAPGATHDEAGEALTCIGTPDAVAALARVASSSKHALARLHLVVKRWPAAAMFALTRLLSSNSKDQSLLSPTLIQLLREHPELPDQLRPWMEPASLVLIDKMLTRLAAPVDIAEAGDLPEVMVSVPWLQAKKKLRPTLQLMPIEIMPVEQWDAGKREQMMRTSSNTSAWYWESLQKAEADPDVMIVEICRLRYQTASEHASERQRASAAIKDGNVAEFIDAMRAIIVALKKDDPKLSYFSYFDALPFSRLPPELGIPCWNAIAGEFPWTHMDAIAGAWGLAALPGLAVNINKEPSNYIDLSQYFGAVELAAIAARVFAKLKTLRGWGRYWLRKFPEHAIAGLIPPALGKAGEARDNAALALRWLARNGHAQLLDQIAARYEQAEVLTALHAMLNENPLERYPNKRASLPDFWNPSGWCRPLLHNGKALSDEALDVLGTMMTFPTNDEVYAGLHQVKTACTTQSLADFAWDCFSAWLNAGAPAKEGWVLTSLGVLGNDEVARKLTPYIRSWPGEGAHARAVTALDVLADIGTDVALMLLNGIAKKIKYKPLQDKATKKIQDIAEARGLTPEELEDRLAPDLGLSEQGSLVLDFGKRAFQVGFDESLKPYVREWLDNKAGARLPDLPKPKQTDDEALAKEATERYKSLKKDVRTIASQQLLRLEVAMCTRRRWSAEVFALFLATHPLVRHLVRRLVWGVYLMSTEQSGDGEDQEISVASYGGQLQSCFRVSEDGSYTTAQDDIFDLPVGPQYKIGLPHALELSASEAAEFAQLLTDYELLQPFPQLGRDTYTLTEEEQSKSNLDRWKGIKVASRKVHGLSAKGWYRTDGDGGVISDFSKAAGDGRILELYFEPGIYVGDVDESPEQTLGELRLYNPSDSLNQDADASKFIFSSVDNILVSELIRDLERLRK